MGMESLDSVINICNLHLQYPWMVCEGLGFETLDKTSCLLTLFFFLPPFIHSSLLFLRNKKVHVESLLR